AVTASLMTSVIAVWWTMRGIGPFIVGGPNANLMLLASFQGIVVVTGLVLAAAIAERRQAEVALPRPRDELEDRISGRTQEILAVNAVLKDEISERTKVEEALRD